MAPPHIKMNIAFPRMISGIQVGESCEERARIVGIRMKVNVIEEVTGQIKKEAESGYGQG
jgi:hypothetical protein